MKNVRAGIIGLGIQGKKYASMIFEQKVEGLELSAVCSRSSSKKQYVEKEYPGVTFFQNYEELIQSDQFDAVIICVPHYQHTEVAEFALQHDKHVLVEKPLSVYVSQAESLMKTAEKKKQLTFAMLFNQRANSVHQRLKKLLADQIIGEIRNWDWTMSTVWRTQAYFDQNEWRATWKGEGGGVLINQASHQIDLIQWLFGMPDKVYANLKYGSRRDIEVDDDVTAFFHYENGASGVFQSRTHDYFGIDRLEISGDKGKIVVEDSERLIVKTFNKPEQEWSRDLTLDEMKSCHNNPDHYTETIEDFGDDSNDPYVRILENFAANIRTDETLIATGFDGLNSMEMINAIYLSDWLRKETKLPVDQEEFKKQLTNRQS
ncbi:Predicted dehydrogenase [Gracilibacillus ureilyticus]|uniref:Predicted dehydrogenase n=1 Tax=Gracilibacillus ureilyticus TaxID=531814 RepID=A0A1H9R434_9BACI|nr:Gfo/Idh/MocA family oxidoreductase [Gracilibacillus ureilyticus]SER67601.1 Predicted dehydrogenase [Gracilibacillus ureilyticus]